MSRAWARAIAMGLWFAGLGLAAQSSDVWLDVPFVQQVKNGCGAASIAMVMQYWIREGYHLPAEHAEPARIHGAVYSRDARGALGADLERYLREHGFETFVFGGEWQDLGQHLAHGRPLIVCLQPRGRGGRRHYLVVVGLDAEHNLVLVNDPAGRKLTKVRRQRFEEQWEATNFWTLLALPAEDR